MVTTDPFWLAVEAQLARVVAEKPDTFEKVSGILMDPVYEALTQYQSVPSHHAFFAGGGGDATLYDALVEAGWRPMWSEAWYFYGMRHPVTNSELHYVEGDVYPGAGRPL